jgi:hypothetical protein
VDINPIVRKATMAEHYDVVPFRMIGDTRIEVPIRKCTTEKHTVRADWLEPAWSSAGKPGRVRLAWTDFYRGSQTRRVLWQRLPRWFIQVQ